MSTFNLVESPLDPQYAVVDAVVDAGDPWLHEIRKGQVFRILDLEGNQAVDTLFFNKHPVPYGTGLCEGIAVLEAETEGLEHGGN